MLKGSMGLARYAIQLVHQEKLCQSALHTWWLAGIATSPVLCLLPSYFLCNFRLALTLETTIMPFVEPPALLFPNPELV